MNRRKKAVAYRRKREGKTDYRKRLELLKSGVPRLVVRASLKNVRAQIIEYHPDGDRVIVSADTHELMKKFGLQKARRNTVTAYLVGLLVGKKALVKKVAHAILDVGIQTPMKNALVYAALKGAVDAGVKVPHDPAIIPDQKRLQGEHLKVSEFAQVKSRVVK
ncbi:MAG TPA: 50S ribosomal protein L18 [Candidatus Nanoarchaeia archaeon]|nr:50S ribosomal protein L18 [Candidatus Nanoarchaeia archaeon]